MSLPLIADRITPLNHVEKKAKNKMNDTFGSKVSFDEAKHGYQVSLEVSLNGNNSKGFDNLDATLA